MRKVFFVTHGNERVGFGHLYRCYSLFRILKDHFDCEFLLFESLNPPFQVNFSLSNSLNEVWGLLVGKYSAGDIVVLDSYEIGGDFVDQLKQLGVATVSINDLPEDALETDLVINHTIGTKADQFEVGKGTKLLLGEEYLLLRPVFLQKATKKGKEKRDEQILICFGGSDPDRMTLKILDYLNNLQIESPIAILTSSESVENEIRKLESEKNFLKIGFFIRQTETQVLELIEASTLAIVPASTIALECFCVGINMICGHYVANQSELSQKIDALGLGVSVGSFKDLEFSDFKSYFYRALNGEYASRQKTLFCHDSSQNILTEFLQLKE